jgi:hypothetical protein
MRKFIPSMLMIAALAAAPAASAADAACKLAGSWIGYLGNNASWTAMADGISNSHGTITIAYPALDPTLFGAFPTAVRVSPLQGVWERTGGRSFAYATVGIAVDALGNSLWIGKLSGTETMQVGCDVELVTATFSVYAPNANPFEDEPLLVLPQSPHYGYRMPAPTP